MFSDEVVEVRGGDLFDMLCARLVWLMQYEEGERYLVWEDGSEVRAPRSQFKKIILMMTFTANAHVHTVSVRRPRRALRDGAYRGPAVRHRDRRSAGGVYAVYCGPIWRVLERQGLGLVERVLRNVLGAIALEAGERSTFVQVHLKNI